MSDKIIITVLLVLAIAVGYWITLPKNVDDCILYHIKKVKTETTASLIMLSCQNKFPKEEEISN